MGRYRAIRDNTGEGLRVAESPAASYSVNEALMGTIAIRKI
jgi:hypothetical protein